MIAKTVSRNLNTDNLKLNEPRWQAPDLFDNTNTSEL